MMKFVWPVLLGLVRTAYLTYSLWCWIFPLVTELLLQLQAGKRVTRAQVVQAARTSAIEKIGEVYDFDCSDATEFNRFSCAELIYYCLRGVLGALQLKPLAHALYPLVPLNTRFKVLERIIITPDDFHDLLPSGGLERVREDSASLAQVAPSTP